MIRLAALVFSVHCLGFVPVANAQGDAAGPAANLPPGGSQLFRALLDFHGIKPVTKLQNYNNTIVVIFGNPRSITDARLIMNAAIVAITHGGALLFATDQDFPLNDYLPNAAAEAQLLKARVLTPAGGFANNPDCPFVSARTFSDMMNGIRDQNPFSGLNHVATNRPAATFTSNLSRAVSFAQFQDGTRVSPKTFRENGRTFTAQFAVGEAQTQYKFPSRWLAMADQDVLSNDMIAARGNDNFVFAYQLVGWLKGEQNRSSCIFFEYGQLVNHFDEVKFVTLPDMPGPPIPPLRAIEEHLTDFGDRFADEVQSKDKIHEKLVGDDVGYAKWLRRFAVVAAAVAAVLLLRWAFAGRQPSPGPITMPIGDGPPGKLLAVLRQEMVRGNNFTPAVTAYIEETFRIAGLPDGPHGAMPPIAITGKKVKKVELMHDITALWQVLFAPADRPPIHYAVWKKLEPAAENARRLAVKGRWRFTTVEGAA